MSATESGRPADTPDGGPGVPDGGPGERAVPKRGPGPAPGGFGRGPAAFMSGMSTEKSLDFKNSSLRLLRMMRPERPLIAVVEALDLRQHHPDRQVQHRPRHLV